MLAAVPHDQALDCRGPLQANRSCRGEQRDYAHLSVSLVKIPPELLEISGGERKERLLPCRGGTATIKMVEQAGQDKDHCERNEQPTTFHNSAGQETRDCLRKEHGSAHDDRRYPKQNRANPPWPTIALFGPVALVKTVGDEQS